ncbi:MAG: hypothetical protein ACKO7W_24680 [Elainella sp.]
MSSGLPDIFAATPSVPVPAQTVAEFPINTFLESIGSSRIAVVSFYI